MMWLGILLGVAAMFVLAVVAGMGRMLREQERWIMELTSACLAADSQTADAILRGVQSDIRAARARRGK